MKSKVADQQIIIEELVKYTGYDINSDCITTDGKLYRELCELAKWVQDHQQILETLKTNFESCYIINHWQGLRIDVNEEWLKEIREVLKDDLPEAILDDLPKAISQKRGRE
ncbi:MAG: hypothetical protein KAS91_00120 [Candidatus Pacebacteria bacterium]|nr:hypothetical protein [Candidatus Paceibacterota bacterium]